MLFFIFASAGSSLLQGLFSACEWGPLSGRGVQASHCGGFPCCGAQSLGRVGFQTCSSWAREHRFSSGGERLGCSTACGIFPGQGSNLCLLWILTRRVLTKMRIFPTGDERWVVWESWRGGAGGQDSLGQGICLASHDIHSQTIPSHRGCPEYCRMLSNILPSPPRVLMNKNVSRYCSGGREGKHHPC